MEVIGMAKNVFFIVTASVLSACVSMTTTAAPKSWPEVDNYIPIQQRQFCDLADDYRINLAVAVSAKNEIKQNKAKKQRQEDLDGLLPGGNFENWIGRVVSVKQVNDPSDKNVDGDAAVVLELWCGVQIGSGQIEVDGSSKWGATINYDSRQYREAAKLSAGDFAIISGQFVTVKNFVPGKRETFYASRPLESSDLTEATNSKYGNGEELFLATINYFASAR